MIESCIFSRDINTMLQSTIIIILVMVLLATLLLSKRSGFVGGAEVEEGVPPILITDVPFTKCVQPIVGELMNRHHGQRKLFIAELDLLTRAVNQHGCKYFVYAGSAPGIHIGRFLELFPTLTFILIDPNEFTIVVNGTNVINYTPTDQSAVYLADGTYDAYKIPGADGPKKIRGIDGKSYLRGQLPIVKQDDYVSIIQSHPETKIFIIERLMTRELARTLRGLGDEIVFMSDIRTNSSDTIPTDGDLLWNMAQMFVWISEMRPLIFSHKHRPLTEKAELMEYMLEDIASAKELGLDLLESPNRYLTGDVYLQTWTSRHSSETRLVGIRQTKKDGSDEKSCGYMTIPNDYTSLPPNPAMLEGFKVADIDVIDYDQRMVYQNRVNRGTRVYGHPAKHIHGIDGCYDCAREAHIWEAYYKSLGIVPTQMMITDDMVHLANHLIVGYNGDEDSIARLHQKTRRTKHNLSINTSASRLLNIQ